MNLDLAVNILLITAIVLANIPFILSQRIFIVIPAPNKSIWLALGEWFLYYLLMGVFAYLLELKAMGNVHPQGWEFYTVTLFMFMIFAFPGFIYRYNLAQFLRKRGGQT
jgi:hypothetical protein